MSAADPAGGADAQGVEAGLREQIADLVRAKARAEREAQRLAGRATLAGAEPGLTDIATRYRAQAGRLGEEVESLRATLRREELETERRRADELGA